VHAALTGRSPLAAARAAGTLIGPPGVARGALAHGALSLAWGVALAGLLPRRHPVACGAAAGLAIAALDLGLLGRRVPAVRALPQLPQVADHVVFGAVAGGVLARCR
jgi:hypothetical protein